MDACSARVGHDRERMGAAEPAAQRVAQRGTDTPCCPLQNDAKTGREKWTEKLGMRKSAGRAV